MSDATHILSIGRTWLSVRVVMISCQLILLRLSIFLIHIPEADYAGIETSVVQWQSNVYPAGVI